MVGSLLRPPLTDSPRKTKPCVRVLAEPCPASLLDWQFPEKQTGKVVMKNFHL